MIPFFSLRRLTLLGWVCLACFLPAILSHASIAAQDPNPDLRQMKSKMRKELIMALLPEKKAYRETLLTLEKKLSGEQDYAGAIRARDERLALEQDIAAMEKQLPMLGGAPSSALPERIVLKSADASLQAVQLDGADNALSGWGVENAAATWSLPDLPAGGYEVLLTYTTGEGASVRVQEAFYSLSAALKPSSKKPLEQNLGTLRIREGKGSLTLSASFTEQGASLRVYSLILVPATR